MPDGILEHSRSPAHPGARLFGTPSAPFHGNEQRCLSQTEIEMAQEKEQTKIGSPQLRLPPGVVPRPRVSLEELCTDTENDPESVEEFVALIRALRKEVSRTVTL
jgi:hypothetical protein